MRSMLLDSIGVAADVAESIATTFDQVAATYLRMVDGTCSPEKRQRLLGHAARLQERADHERHEAGRLRHRAEQ